MVHARFWSTADRCTRQASDVAALAARKERHQPGSGAAGHLLDRAETLEWTELAPTVWLCHARCGCRLGCVMPDPAVGHDYKALDARSTRTARSFLRQLHAEWVPADRPTVAAVHHNRVFCWQQAGIGYVTREE